LLLQAVLLLPEHDELLEFVSVFFGIAKEVVHKKLFGVCSSLWVLVKATSDEVAEGLAPLRVL
jgi:hypothetical protein